jgi:hypothetical protein
MRGATDVGRDVPLFRYEAYMIPVGGQQLSFHPGKDGRGLIQIAEERFLETTKQDASKFVRLFEANPRCNCHGWVFTGGQRGIEDAHIRMILADNGYMSVTEAREGDVAVYETAEGISHSGLVRTVSSRFGIVIESKWGPFGVYIHGSESHPFPGTCKYYRSQRSGHLVTVRRMDESQR